MILNMAAANKTLTFSEKFVDALSKHALLNFYVTGSRFLGGATEKSDWDFFVQDSSTAQVFLQMMRGAYPHHFVGKVVNPSSSKHMFWMPTKDNNTADLPYSDHNCAEVWRWEGIDIQVVADAPLKIKAQDFISKMLRSGWIMPADKSSRRKIWERAYKEVQF